MNEMEFRACNEEVAAMVAANRRLPRKTVHFLPEEEWTKYQAKLNEKEVKPVAEDRPPQKRKDGTGPCTTAGVYLRRMAAGRAGRAGRYSVRGSEYRRLRLVGLGQL